MPITTVRSIEVIHAEMDALNTCKVFQQGTVENTRASVLEMEALVTLGPDANVYDIDPWSLYSDAYKEIHGFRPRGFVSWLEAKEFFKWLLATQAQRLADEQAYREACLAEWKRHIGNLLNSTTAGIYRVLKWDIDANVQDIYWGGSPDHYSYEWELPTCRSVKDLVNLYYS